MERVICCCWNHDHPRHLRSPTGYFPNIFASFTSFDFSVLYNILFLMFFSGNFPSLVFDWINSFGCFKNVHVFRCPNKLDLLMGWLRWLLSTCFSSCIRIKEGNLEEMKKSVGVYGNILGMTIMVMSIVNAWSPHAILDWSGVVCTWSRLVNYWYIICSILCLIDGLKVNCCLGLLQSYLSLVISYWAHFDCFIYRKRSWEFHMGWTKIILSIHCFLFFVTASPLLQFLQVFYW